LKCVAKKGWRRLSWADRVSNKEVFNRVKEEENIGGGEYLAYSKKKTKEG
jgi:hypothetical protein